MKASVKYCAIFSTWYPSAEGFWITQLTVVADSKKVIPRREIRLIGRIVLAVIRTILAPMVRLIPRDDTLWVFGNSVFFGDNPKYLLDYVAAEHAEIRCVWIAHSADQRDAAQAAGYEAALAYSPTGIMYMLRAGVGVIQASHKDLNRFCVDGMHIAQLWHGFPIKRIILDHSEDWKSHLPLVGGIITKMCRWAVWRNYRADQVFAASQEEADRLGSALEVDAERIKITGTPREDIILQSRENDRMGGSRLAKCRYQILYAPTYRRAEYSGRFWKALKALLSSERLQRVMEKSRAEMLVKLHPFMNSHSDTLSQISGSRCRILQRDGPSSVNDLLPVSDLLITDYSSVAVDFALLERPILFFTPDLDLYRQVRSFYGSLSDVTDGTQLVDVEQLIDAMELSLQIDIPENNEYIVQGRKISKNLRSYADGKSRSRITEKIKNK